MELRNSGPDINSGKSEKFAPPGSIWKFSRRGSVLLFPEMYHDAPNESFRKLKFEEYRDPSKAPSHVKLLVNGLSKQVVTEGWNFADALRLPIDEKKKREYLSIVFVNPSRPELVKESIHLANKNTPHDFLRHPLGELWNRGRKFFQNEPEMWWLIKNSPLINNFLSETGLIDCGSPSVRYNMIEATKGIGIFKRRAIYFQRGVIIFGFNLKKKA